MTKLTAAEKRALAAVSSGQVTRVYRASGNVLKGPKGIGARTLWSLDRKGYITDGGPTWGYLELTCRQVLTKAGMEALTTSDGQKT